MKKIGVYERTSGGRGEIGDLGKLGFSTANVLKFWKRAPVSLPRPREAPKTKRFSIFILSGA